MGADAEQCDVDVAEVRPAVLDRRQVRLAPPGGERQRLARGGPDVRRVALVPEVGVPVDVDEADAMVEAAHRQPGSQQDRAVSAQYQRKLTGGEDRADAVGEALGEQCDLVRLRDAVAGLPASRVEPRWRDAAGVAGTKPGD